MVYVRSPLAVRSMAAGQSPLAVRSASQEWDSSRVVREPMCSSKFIPK